MKLSYFGVEFEIKQNPDYGCDPAYGSWFNYDVYREGSYLKSFLSLDEAKQFVYSQGMPR